MEATHPHGGGQVQRLLWAVGEAHRRRRRADRVGRPSIRAELTATMRPAAAAGPTGPGVGADAGVAGPARSVVGRGGRVALIDTGELSGSTAPDFLDRVLALVEERSRSIVVDLGGVEVVDSQGVAALASAETLLVSLGGELVLRSPRSRILTELDAAGLGNRFVIC